MRAFDLLSKAEQEIRTASHPRYHFEMVLLRWMHLRKLVPLVDLLEGGGGSAPTRSAIAPTSSKIAPTSAAAAQARTDKQCSRTDKRQARTDKRHRRTDERHASHRREAPSHRQAASSHRQVTQLAPTSDTVAPAPGGLKDTFLAEIRSSKSTLYNIVVAQAQRIDVTDDRITFTFAPNQNVRARAVRSEPRMARVGRRIGSPAGGSR